MLFWAVDVYLSSDAKNVASGTGYFLHGSDSHLKIILDVGSPRFLGFSWQVIQVDKSSILAGPAEDVVEKWPGLKQRNMETWTHHYTFPYLKKP
jgi:hypothetical protein